MRQLATVREITNIWPIANADAIEVAQVDGWEVVVKKGEFTIGEPVVYIEVDSLMPPDKRWDFLESRKWRVRTIKLRGQVSQGLILPIDIVPKSKRTVGTDVTDVLGIVKYDPQGDKERDSALDSAKKRSKFLRFMFRFKWFKKWYKKKYKPRRGGFPHWIHKTDEERIQNLSAAFERWKEEELTFTATEKLDGQSATYFYKDKFGVCSRNILLETEDDSSYWTIARQYDLKDKMKIFGTNGNMLVIQGEIIGEGIQKNKYGVKGYEFYVFNVIKNGKVLNQREVDNFCDYMNLKSVDTIVTDFPLLHSIADMVQFAKGKSKKANIQREGLVFRNYEKGISFKVINPDFLLKFEE